MKRWKVQGLVCLCRRSFSLVTFVTVLAFSRSSHPEFQLFPRARGRFQFFLVSQLPGDAVALAKARQRLNCFIPSHLSLFQRYRSSLLSLSSSSPSGRGLR